MPLSLREELVPAQALAENQHSKLCSQGRPGDMGRWCHAQACSCPQKLLVKEEDSLLPGSSRAAGASASPSPKRQVITPAHQLCLPPAETGVSPSTQFCWRKAVPFSPI